MISGEEARAWIEAYGEAWVSQDPARVVRLFTQDTIYRERRFHPGLHGIEQVRDYWQLIVHELQRDVGFEVLSVAVDGDSAYFNWHAHFTWRPINGIMELDAISRVRFTEESRDGRRLATEFEEWIDHREV